MSFLIVNYCYFRDYDSRYESRDDRYYRGSRDPYYDEGRRYIFLGQPAKMLRPKENRVLSMAGAWNWVVKPSGSLGGAASKHAETPSSWKSSSLLFTRGCIKFFILPPGRGKIIKSVGEEYQDLKIWGLGKDQVVKNFIHPCASRSLKSFPVLNIVKIEIAKIYTPG